MTEKSARSRKGTRKIKAALQLLSDLGLPREQLNERSALTLLALLDLKPNDEWSAAKAPLVGITQMMDFFAAHYGRKYAPNSRETVRRFTMHQFVQAGLAVPNPDESRPTNSPKFVYQIEPIALKLVRNFGTVDWNKDVELHLGKVQGLAAQYKREREMQRIPVKFAGKEISLSAGGQNPLIKAIIEEFCERFTPGGEVVYIGDADKKWAYYEETILTALGVIIGDAHGKMPDLVIYYRKKNWLVLVEAVTSHGPIGPKRRVELEELFAGSKAGLVFVTAFMNRKTMMRYISDISWESEVWIAESPTHMIHFNGERFLGPYEK